jgi:CubicO group peptidase (beta-lactamase class C family)
VTLQTCQQGDRIVQVHRLAFISFGFFVVAASASAAAGPLPEAKPESVGFSVERLKALDAALQQTVDTQKFAGIVTMMARHGKLVEQKTYGQQDLASNTPIQKDTIFRIYSMTKPITGTAMMILYEEGKWKPSDPIAKYIPEFADLKVYKGTDRHGPWTVEAPAHSPTIGELMSHTAGFSYGFFEKVPVDKLYKKAGLFQSASLGEFIARLAKLPLMYQPGEAWAYSVAVDVQGYLVEKLSGKPFPDFVRERILVPLGMKDTDFFVPPEKLARLATVYKPDANGALVAVPHAPNVTQPPGLRSGGGGMYSTAGDYLRFAQMLLSGGELNGVRLLAPSTVQLMRSNHLPERLLTGKFGIGPYVAQPGLGFGYDFAVTDDPIRVGSTVGKGSYYWNGLAGTWFWIDPTNDLVFVGMVQRLVNEPGMPDMESLSRALVYQALVAPAK